MKNKMFAHLHKYSLGTSTGTNVCVFILTKKSRHQERLLAVLPIIIFTKMLCHTTIVARARVPSPAGTSDRLGDRARPTEAQTR